MARSSVSIKPQGRRVLVDQRERRNLTRLSAAVGIGISPQTLARAENGGEIRPKVLDQIAAFYELDAHELIGKAS